MEEQRAHKLTIRCVCDGLRQKGSTAVRDANTGNPRVASQAKQSKTNGWVGVGEGAMLADKVVLALWSAMLVQSVPSV